MEYQGSSATAQPRSSPISGLICLFGSLREAEEEGGRHTRSPLFRSVQISILCQVTKPSHRRSEGATQPLPCEPPPPDDARLNRYFPLPCSCRPSKQASVPKTSIALIAVHCLKQSFPIELARSPEGANRKGILLHHPELLYHPDLFLSSKSHALIVERTS